ncbi:5-oxoprolinase subunit B family protein [Ruania alba]|uniref:Sensor histidine kinase inhibitor, KipI family n=1 Tax=Ruania alba TaxID=648782 RepID=A0A1H5NHC9_9MICO|nr:allophanate hydrolase subunit 1 [Ruania alba]SEF00880.1 sensor histidine kinase inhibitor, KipI family [Ruania alba]
MSAVPIIRALPCGERAVLLEVEDLTAVHALTRSLHEARARGELSGVIDVVPATRTVLVTVSDPAALARVAALAQNTVSAGSTEAPAVQDDEAVVIEVRYDGPDLEDVARLTGLSAAEVIARHTAATYTADFLGFAPGFAYLSGLDPSLHVSRLESPRPSVPAGAVAIAGDKSAVYPRSSPGGWRLLGHTDAVLFDHEADPPALLRAGTRVRFREVD